jgi:glucose-6-phosphate isomerase
LLHELKVSKASFEIKKAFDQDPGRFDHFGLQAPHLFVDLSKSMWDREVESALLELANQTNVLALRDAMFAGHPINTTENRAVMHWLLRTPDHAQVDEHLQNAHKQVVQTRNAFLAFADKVREDESITDIVNIGIGGSDLGPQMTVKALEEYVIPGKKFHFVSNIDAHEIAGVLRSINPNRTLFLISSKTFSTIETMTNARTAKQWFLDHGGVDLNRHFVGLTSNTALAKEFGIETTFGFWDWVGGRYSMWSSIGLVIAIAIGSKGFRDFLQGAHEVDEHFRNSGIDANVALKLGLLDVWYRNFLHYKSRSVAPYHSSLARLPAYLQQLDMESNGKSVDKSDQHLSYGTASVVWGETGTNGQHAYFQMLHQGTDVIPIEFIAIKEPAHQHKEHHQLLLANALAQAQAFMSGDVNSDKAKDFSGNRPSIFTVMDRLTPASFGALIALSEHRTFVAGAVWGINSFDQFGVELGKTLTLKIMSQFASEVFTDLDPSTQGLLRRLRSV